MNQSILIGAATSQGVKATFTNDEVHLYSDGKLHLFRKRTRSTIYCLNISIDMEETNDAMAAKHSCPLSDSHIILLSIFTYPFSRANLAREVLSYIRQHHLKNVGSRSYRQAESQEHHPVP
jgi:hypothetical protein